MKSKLVDVMMMKMAQLIKNSVMKNATKTS